MQATLEKAITAVTGEDVRTQGSGRTDAGAHALHQVVAFSTASRLPVGDLQRAINFHLPCDVAVSQTAEVPEDFNPRGDASSRTYRYLIWNRPVRSPFHMGRAAHIKEPLDAGRMHQAARLLLGRHDMSAFIPVRTESNRERTVFDASCTRRGDMIVIEIEATGFMKQMVRAIAGTLILVGKGKMSPPQFGEALASRDRRRAGDTAPAHGLYLAAVNYMPRDREVEKTFVSGYPFETNWTPVTCEEIP